MWYVDALSFRRTKSKYFGKSRRLKHANFEERDGSFAAFDEIVDQ